MNDEIITQMRKQNEIIEEIWKEDEIIRQILVGVAAKEITICETCDTIFPYTPNRKYCDECRKSLQEKFRSYQREYMREYYHKNKARLLAQQREYRINNWERVRAIERKSEEKRRRKRNE